MLLNTTIKENKNKKLVSNSPFTICFAIKKQKKQFHSPQERQQQKANHLKDNIILLRSFYRNFLRKAIEKVEKKFEIGEQNIFIDRLKKKKE